MNATCIRTSPPGSRWRRIFSAEAISSTALLILFGLLILNSGIHTAALAQGAGPTGSFTEAALEDDLIRNAVGNLFKLVEGAFGALVMVVAGIGAISAASMGAYRACLGMIVVAIGSFILRALVSLFFGSDFVDFEAT